MLHALDHLLRLPFEDQGDLGLTIFIGSSRSGAVLEVGVLDEGTSQERVVHCMPARPKYWP